MHLVILFLFLSALHEPQAYKSNFPPEIIIYEGQETVRNLSKEVIYEFNLDLLQNARYMNIAHENKITLDGREILQYIIFRDDWDLYFAFTSSATIHNFTIFHLRSDFSSENVRYYYFPEDVFFTLDALYAGTTLLVQGLDRGCIFPVVGFSFQDAVKTATHFYIANDPTDSQYEFNVRKIEINTPF